MSRKETQLHFAFPYKCARENPRKNSQERITRANVTTEVIA